MTDKTIDFPKEKGFQTYSAIYVPSTKNGNKPISRKEHEKRADEVRRFMNKKFGGTTTVKGTGSYTGSEGNIKGKVVKEEVFIVENFSQTKDYAKHDLDIQNFVQNKAKTWGQESMGYEFESPQRPRRLVFVKARERKKLNNIV